MGPRVIGYHSFMARPRQGPVLNRHQPARMLTEDLEVPILPGVSLLGVGCEEVRVYQDTWGSASKHRRVLVVTFHDPLARPITQVTAAVCYSKAR